MAYSEKLAERVREALIEANVRQIEEKKMFKGICFMVKGKMCICVNESELLLRVGPSVFETTLEEEGVRPMIHNGKTMKGFVFVEENVVRTAKALKEWVHLALAFNEEAKASKKKTASKSK
jgi:TfoX/Sxy family transcriptional regulator of competence genes